MNILYQIFISPLEAVMQVVLSASHAVTGHYGVSLLVLSLCVNLAILPLYHIAENWQQAERRVQSRLQPKLREFRQAFSGEERFMMIRTLYRQAGYHPIYALRTSVGFLIQVPFFIAAYHLLSHYDPLHGVSFLIFDDLGKPDALLWGINVMPFVMTGVNLLAVFVYAQTLTSNDKLQLWVISLLFLVLLYTAPVALVLYWTFNNVFSVVKNLAYARFHSIRKIKTGRVDSTIPGFQAPITSISEATDQEAHREPITFWKKRLQSPYVLALLVGLYPVLFFVSTNRPMFNASEALFILGTAPLITCTFLSGFYLALSWCMRKIFPTNFASTIQKIFVPMAFLVLAYQLRLHLLPMVEYKFSVFLIMAIGVAAIVSWLTPKMQMFRINIVLLAMCMVPLGVIGFYAISPSGTNNLVSSKGYSSKSELYDKVKFTKSPKVYYLVPDGYPNREALETIYGMKNTMFYQQLESLGFMINHSALSNYKPTPESLSASFGMDHHYYQATVGNVTMVDPSQYITSEQNPVVHIFKNNGYQVHFVHEWGTLFTRGCFVDSCFPHQSFPWWRDFMEIVFPSKLLSLPILNKIAPRHESGEFVPEFVQKVLTHIDWISSQDSPQFTYIHTEGPSHGNNIRTPADLSLFRKGYIQKIQVSNNELIRILRHVRDRDPSALVIVNADHGPFGVDVNIRGGNKVGEGIPENLIGLDNLGVLLAIRWPYGAQKQVQEIKTNVNLFRHIFSHLSDSDVLLASQVDDHGFLTKMEKEKFILLNVARDGEILEQMVDMGPIKKLDFR